MSGKWRYLPVVEIRLNLGLNLVKYAEMAPFFLNDRKLIIYRWLKIHWIIEGGKGFFNFSKVLPEMSMLILKSPFCSVVLFFLPQLPSYFPDSFFPKYIPCLCTRNASTKVFCELWSKLLMLAEWRHSSVREWEGGGGGKHFWVCGEKNFF